MRAFLFQWCIFCDRLRRARGMVENRVNVPWDQAGQCEDFVNRVAIKWQLLQDCEGLVNVAEFVPGSDVFSIDS